MGLKKRVVVTGAGAISSVGNGKNAFWQSIINGKSGISEVTSFDTSEFKCHNAGEIKDFKAENFISFKKVKFLGRASQLAIAATSLACKDAQLTRNILPKKKFGVIIGTTTGEKPLEELIQSWTENKFKDLDKAKILQASANNISANVGIEFKTTGINMLIPTACAAGNYAIGYAYDLIQAGELNFVFAGGAEAFSRIAFTGFQRLYAMSEDICRPFDKNRKGMLLGEGAGILLLESLESAKKRNVPIYAEIIGYGLSCDAFHTTIPTQEGVEKAMANAIKNANISYSEVDYICAHGTGTTQNDKSESLAINSLFKGRKIPVSSLKSMLGHTMGAASALEAIACCMAVKTGIIPPTINFETPDPECDINCVPNAAQERNVNIVINNAFAFGGNNSALVIKKFSERCYDK